RALSYQCDPLRAREPLGLSGDLEDVRVLRDRPERLVAVGLQARDRGLGAQLRPHRVRVAVARVPHRVDEVVRVDVDHFGSAFPEPASLRALWTGVLTPVRDGEGSRGKPRMRSPMIVRWISLVPPMIE